MLDEIVEEIKSQYRDNLRAIFLAGSCATGERIEGWPDSDWDIVIVLRYVTNAEKQKVSEIGEKFSLTDEYNLIPKSADELAKSTGLWALLDKYHAQFLYGEHFKEEICAPTHIDIARDSLKIIRKVSGKFDKWKYSTFKSDIAFKQGMYWVLKRAVSLFASSYYLETGDYISERSNLGLKSKSVEMIVDALNKYPDVTRQEIIQVFPQVETVIEYVKTVSEWAAEH